MNNSVFENNKKYFTHIGEKKSKFIVNFVASQVIKNDDNEKLRTKYMSQLSRITGVFIHTFKKSPF